MNKNRNVLIGIVVVVVIALLGYFAWQERGTSAPSSVASSTPITIATSTVASSTSSGSPYTIKLVSGTSTMPAAPNFAAPLSFAASVTPDEQASLESEFAQTQAVLKKNTMSFDGWIELGVIRKEAGDYAGAAADWQYISALYPQNIVSFADLADLYTNFMPDYPKAAAAYQQAIANNPKTTYLYEDLFQLYTNQYPQGSSDPSSVLKQGIAANPSAADLKAALAQYEQSKGTH